MISAIALFASSRRNGNTGRLMDRIAQELRIEVVDLAQKRMTAYDYQHRNRRDEFEPLMEHVLRFDQVIFASPVYWYGVSPPMKVFLDRISDFLDLPDLLERGRLLRGKYGHVVCTSIEDAVPAPFIQAFSGTFNYLGMRMGAVAHADCRDGYSLAKHESETLAFIRSVRNCSLESGGGSCRPGETPMR